MDSLAIQPRGQDPSLVRLSLEQLQVLNNLGGVTKIVAGLCHMPKSTTFNSDRRMAELMRVNLTVVRQALKVLERHGIVEIKKLSNYYQFQSSLSWHARGVRHEDDPQVFIPVWLLQADMKWNYKIVYGRLLYLKYSHTHAPLTNRLLLAKDLSLSEHETGVALRFLEKSLYFKKVRRGHKFSFHLLKHGAYTTEESEVLKELHDLGKYIPGDHAPPILPSKKEYFQDLSKVRTPIAVPKMQAYVDRLVNLHPQKQIDALTIYFNTRNKKTCISQVLDRFQWDPYLLMYKKRLEASYKNRRTPFYLRNHAVLSEAETTVVYNTIKCPRTRKKYIEYLQKELPKFLTYEARWHFLFSTFCYNIPGRRPKSMIVNRQAGSYQRYQSCEQQSLEKPFDAASDELGKKQFNALVEISQKTVETELAANLAKQAGVSVEVMKKQLTSESRPTRSMFNSMKEYLAADRKWQLEIKDSS